MEEPFFEENELGKSLRNEIVKELISGKVYCAACKNIFNNAALNKTHQKFTYFSTVAEIFDQLTCSSITVIDENDEIVTPDDIADDSPFYCSSHLGLIDALMAAYAMRVMQPETLVNSMKYRNFLFLNKTFGNQLITFFYRKYTNFDSSEVPSSLEHKCSLWLNKIMQTVLQCVQTECETYAKQVTTLKTLILLFKGVNFGMHPNRFLVFSIHHSILISHSNGSKDMGFQSTKIGTF